MPFQNIITIVIMKKKIILKAIIPLDFTEFFFFFPFLCFLLGCINKEWLRAEGKPKTQKNKRMMANFVVVVCLF